jgi:hypothetical protein
MQQTIEEIQFVCRRTFPEERGVHANKLRDLTSSVTTPFFAVTIGEEQGFYTLGNLLLSVWSVSSALEHVELSAGITREGVRDENLVRECLGQAVIG